MSIVFVWRPDESMSQRINAAIQCLWNSSSSGWFFTICSSLLRIPRINTIITCGEYPQFEVSLQLSEKHPSVVRNSIRWWWWWFKKKNTTIHLNLTHINCFQFKRKMFGSISITPTFHPFIHPSHSFSHLDIHSTIYPITSHPSIQSGSPQTKANGCQDLSKEKQQQKVSFKCEFKYFVRSFVGRWNLCKFI